MSLPESLCNVDLGPGIGSGVKVGPTATEVAPLGDEVADHCSLANRAMKIGEARATGHRHLRTWRTR